jgi:hypothetical protein
MSEKGLASLTKKFKPEQTQNQCPIKMETACPKNAFYKGVSQKKIYKNHKVF